MSKAHPPELKKYMEKKLTLKLNGGRTVTGILRGFDPFMNLVVDESIEETKTGEKRSIGMVVVRGNSIVLLESLDRVAWWIMDVVCECCVLSVVTWTSVWMLCWSIVALTRNFKQKWTVRIWLAALGLRACVWGMRLKVTNIWISTNLIFSFCMYTSVQVHHRSVYLQFSFQLKVLHGNESDMFIVFISVGSPTWERKWHVHHLRYLHWCLCCGSLLSDIFIFVVE